MATAAADQPLVAAYAGVLFDVDGVALHMDDGVPGAAEAIRQVRDLGLKIAFVTNNASRTAGEVAGALDAAGIPTDPDDIITSAVTAASMLEPGTRCFAIGMAGLRTALTDRGCVLVDGEAADDGAQVDAVVVGWDRELVWNDLRRATLALDRGARFVATNADVSYPAAEGPWPGNGAVVTALAAAANRQPEVAGKPETAMFLAAAKRLPDGPKLMVGDRPDTDLKGAAALGWDTALVLTGVTRPADADAVWPRPTWVLDDLSALLRPASKAAEAAGQEGAGVSVRPALERDTDAILALWATAGLSEDSLDPRADIATAVRGGVLLVALDDDNVVRGVVQGVVDGTRGWLQRLCFAPEGRGQGMGRALVAAGEHRLSGLGVGHVQIALPAGDDQAVAFAEHLGYATGPQLVVRSKRL